MSIPDEFKELCLQFQLASLSFHGSPDAMISAALQGSGPKEKEVIRGFLDKLLSEPPDVAMLQAAWASVPPDFFIPDDRELFLFLKLVQRTVQDALGESM